MIVAKEKTKHNIKTNGQIFEQTDGYEYLGTIIAVSGQIDKEIDKGRNKGGKIYNITYTIFLRKRDVQKNVKVEVLNKIVKLMYKQLGI